MERGERRISNISFSKDILKRRWAKAEDAFYMKKGDVYQDEHSND